MKFRQIGICASFVALSGASAGLAIAATPPYDHSAHHPAQTAPKPSAEATRVDEQLKTMQDMHQKMQAAKTSEERAALMQDHMKAMQDGMSMMGQMKKGMSTDGMPKDGAKRPSMMMGTTASGRDIMERRMSMMEMSMQMMMDRQGAVPSEAK
jgi:hypothetical protein